MGKTRKKKKVSGGGGGGDSCGDWDEGAQMMNSHTRSVCTC